MRHDFYQHCISATEVAQVAANSRPSRVNGTRETESSLISYRGTSDGSGGDHAINASEIIIIVIDINIVPTIYISHSIKFVQQTLYSLCNV